MIIDELCTCGALKSKHGARFPFAPGHGGCEESGCIQFTWKAFVEEGCVICENEGAHEGRPHVQAGQE